MPSPQQLAEVDFRAAAPITGVIFDFHATLVDQGDPDEWLDRALARAPHEITSQDRVRLTTFLDRIWENARVHDPMSTRDLSFTAHRDVFHTLLAEGPAVDPSLADALYSVLLDTWHAYADTLAMLQALHGSGIRIAVLSNAGVPIREVLEREGISPWVHATVISYEVGVVKPNPAIFQAALDALGIDAQNALMVGDSATDDIGGTALGIRTLILPRTKGTVHGLDVVARMVLGDVPIRSGASPTR